MDLRQLFDGLYYDGLSIACVADIDVDEAVRRLDAEIADAEEDPDDLLLMWATAVPGGCVIAQPWCYGAQMPSVTVPLSVDTTCYAMYANPKSGNQGSIIRGGAIASWDLHPGGEGEDPLSVEYEFHALAYCFAYVGLNPTDTRSVTGPPDRWIRVSDRDYQD